ncbi:hypothetical protein LINPERPRIM_LOCUS32427, partial [Linum perenne]
RIVAASPNQPRRRLASLASPPPLCDRFAASSNHRASSPPPLTSLAAASPASHRRRLRVIDSQPPPEMYVQQLRQIRQQEREASRSEKALPKSVSVGMGFMGRIDEDNAFEEFEDDAAGAAGAGTGKINDKLGDKYPRSKSYNDISIAISKRLVVF